jgi:ubiquinol-cytochrome c reductase iron-sulfur subunit
LSDPAEAIPSPEDPGRRDFIHILTGALAVGGAAAVAWPLIDQMEPSSNVISAGSPVPVDLSKVAPGQQITVLWRSNPTFIVNRTPAMLAKLASPDVADLVRDPGSESLQQPPYAKNWSRSIKPQWAVLVGVCTHLGCVPGFTPSPGSVQPNWPGGWFCPCHGSKYDLAGRVFKSVPAPLNLPVPPYSFTNDTEIMIGQNPPGETFEISDVQGM